MGRIEKSETGSPTRRSENTLRRPFLNSRIELQTSGSASKRKIPSCACTAPNTPSSVPHCSRQTTALRRCGGNSTNCSSGRDLFGGREPVDRRGLVSLTRLQLCGRKRRLVRRIREMLRLQAEPGTMGVHFPALSVQRTVQKIPCIKLDPRFRRQN